MSLSVLLRPKIALPLGAAIAVMFLTAFIHRAVTEYGTAQYVQGAKDTHEIYAVHIAETKAAFKLYEDELNRARAETEIVYVDVVKEVAVSDAVSREKILARDKIISNLELEIVNANPDVSECALAAIPDDSVSIHAQIDGLFYND